MTNRKKEIMIITTCLLLAAVLIGIFYLIPRPEGAYVIVQRNNRDYASFPLSINTEQILKGNNGLTCTLVIEDGKASVSKADCPDLICKKHTPICKVGETIICLPAGFVITVVENEKAVPPASSLDGIV